MTYIFYLAGHRDKSAPPCVKSLGCRKCDREKGVRGPENFKPSVCLASMVDPSGCVHQCLPAESRKAPG